ncbi:MAG: OTU domain-containing protein [Candidatus Nucleicultricaceae bacterium]
MISRSTLLLALLTSTFMPMSSSFASKDDIIIIEEKEGTETPPKSSSVSLDIETARFLRNPHASYDKPIELQDIEDAKVWMQRSEKYSFFDPLTGQEMLAVKAKVIGDGNCAFTAMRLSRVSSIQSVIDQADNQFLRGLMAERFIKNKRSFIQHFEGIQYDSDHYLAYVTSLGRDENGDVEEVPLNAALDDEMSTVAFASSMNVVVLTYVPIEEDVTRHLLYPTALFRNPKPINIQTAYLIFEGRGRHGNFGIHYNMMVPAECPDDLSEEDYNKLIVHAKRRQDAADLWKIHVLLNAERESEALKKKNPQALKLQVEHDNKRDTEEELLKKRKATSEPKTPPKGTKQSRDTLEKKSPSVPRAPQKKATKAQSKPGQTQTRLFAPIVSASEQLENQSQSWSPRPYQPSHRFTYNFSSASKTGEQK